jgi:serine/threonine protein kinase
MNCRQIEDLLLDFLEGELDPPSRAEVENHLQTCRSCADYRSELKITLSALSLAGSSLTEASTLRVAGSLREGSAAEPPASSVPAEGPGRRRQLGDFHIVREIGRGGMGVVYDLKVLSSGLSPDASVVTRFTREARTVGRLEHANIVPVYAVGESQGVHFYPMQYIDGKPLSVACREVRDNPQARGKAHYETVAHWGLQAAEALHHAHTRGVVHRDVKPSNLLLDNEGKVWVSDFGLAKADAFVSITETGNILGTPRYMAPEQCCEDVAEVGPLSDIYSLGATLYELASGRPLFEGDGRSIVTKHLARVRPPAIKTIDPAIPEDLAVIISQCIEALPQDRYDSAEELATDLRLFLAGEPIKARRMSLAKRTWRRIERHRRALATVASITIILASTIWLIQFFGDHIQRITGRSGIWIGWQERPNHSLRGGADGSTPSAPAPSPAADRTDDAAENKSEKSFLPDASDPQRPLEAQSEASSR